MLRKLLAAALFALSFTTGAQAASRVWISEFGLLTPTNGATTAQVAPLPSLTNQSTLDISGGVQSSAAFGSATRYIRILCEVQCAVKGGSGATTSDMLIPALLPEYLGVQPGATISVIAAP
jgi:hypothetical protein